MADFKELQQAVDRFARTRILVIGDVIVDQFIWGTVSRISPEAPVPVVNVTREELLLGGSSNVLRNIISLGGSCALCGIIGADAMGDELLALLRGAGAPIDGLVRGRRPTILKTRVVAQGQQVVRYDREKVENLPARLRKKFWTTWPTTSPPLMRLLFLIIQKEWSTKSL